MLQKARYLVNYAVPLKHLQRDTTIRDMSQNVFIQSISRNTGWVLILEDTLRPWIIAIHIRTVRSSRAEHLAIPMSQNVLPSILTDARLLSTRRTVRLLASSAIRVKSMADWPAGGDICSFSRNGSAEIHPIQTPDLMHAHNSLPLPMPSCDLRTVDSSTQPSGSVSFCGCFV